MDLFHRYVNPCSAELVEFFFELVEFLKPAIKPKNIYGQLLDSLDKGV